MSTSPKQTPPRTKMTHDSEGIYQNERKNLTRFNNIIIHSLVQQTRQTASVLDAMQSRFTLLRVSSCIVYFIPGILFENDQEQRINRKKKVNPAVFQIHNNLPP